MQAIMETIFDIVYLCTVVALGILMIVKSGENRQFKLFGVMAVTLGCGDAFHLAPRAYALCTDGLANHAAALGIGKLVTSVTMTVFYVILYHIYRLRYEKNHYGNGKAVNTAGVTAVVYALAVLRIVLCLMPQNRWTDANAPISWGIYRNIPFALLGLLIIVLFFRAATKGRDQGFRHMWLAVTLSFAFYIPVVLFADRYPLAGVLMIPKTCAYVWIVAMGYLAMRRETGK